MVLLPATIKGDPCQLKYEPMQLLKPIPWHYASHFSLDCTSSNARMAFICA